MGGISDTIKSVYDDAIKEYGTKVLAFSSSGTYNDYGDKTTSYTGSEYTDAILSYLTPDEKQILPEGERTDSIIKFLVKTTQATGCSIGDKINISGSANNYEVFSISDLPIIDNAIVYKQVVTRKMR